MGGTPLSDQGELTDSIQSSHPHRLDTLPGSPLQVTAQAVEEQCLLLGRMGQVLTAVCAERVATLMDKAAGAAAAATGPATTHPPAQGICTPPSFGGSRARQMPHDAPPGAPPLQDDVLPFAFAGTLRTLEDRCGESLVWRA